MDKHSSASEIEDNEKDILVNKIKPDAFTETELAVYAALETYSNVHRGSGHYSMVTTHLFEKAREIVLEYLGLKKNTYVVIFCNLRQAAHLTTKLKPGCFHILASKDFGLSIGVTALVLERKALPKGVPFYSGGGTTKLISTHWVIWAEAPYRFEAGTPSVINVIAFAKALLLIRQYGKEIFFNTTQERLTAIEILYHDNLEKYSGPELLNELRETMTGRDILVPTMRGNTPFINLDNAASTPAFMPVWNTVCQTWRQSRQVQQEIIREVRSVCAEVLNAPPAAYDVIFTSNTTEAVNLVAESLGLKTDLDTESVIITTYLEHSSNDLPWRMISGASLLRLSVDPDGFLNLEELDLLLSEYNQKCLHGKQRIKIVAVSGCSNVLGIFNDLEEISRIVHLYGAQLLVDAAQVVAHRRISLEGSGIDYLAFSAHKLYAPFGCGVLVVKKGLLQFAHDEMKMIQSSGEENATGIAALGKALVLLNRVGLELIQKEEQALTERALRGMSAIDGLRIYGIKDPESNGFAYKGGVILFGMKGVMPDKIANELAVKGGIGVRYGCHCAHILIKHILGVSPVLERFQRVIVTLFPRLQLPGLARMSLGIGNTKEDVDTLIRILDEIVKKNNNSRKRISVSSDHRNPEYSKAEVKKQMKEFVSVSGLRVFTSDLTGF